MRYLPPQPLSALVMPRSGTHWPVIKGTFIPSIQFDREFLSLLVVVIGTTLSVYLYTGNPMKKPREKKPLGAGV